MDYPTTATRPAREGDAVDLELSEEQQLFQKTTRRFLEKSSPMSRVRDLSDSDNCFDRTLWRQAGELGWFSLLVTEDDGGGCISGGPLADLCIVAEEAGRAVFSGPLLACNVVIDAISRSGSVEQRAEHLPALIAGDSIAAWAFAEPDDSWNCGGVTLTATPSAHGYRLDGVKSCVQDATNANVLLVTAELPEGLTQFLLPTDSPGVSFVALESMDIARRFADVVFDDVEVPERAILGGTGAAAAAAERQLNVANVLLCAETVGAVDRLYEMTLDYAKVRKAFGRPIGSFQALKHRFANMLVWLEGAKAITVFAAQAVDADADAAESASVAKVYVSERGQAIARDCLQIHGGIGYTWEHDLHYFLRRVESNAVLYGGADHHRDRVADLIGMRRDSKAL